MSLQLICGRSGTGKSELCLKETLEDIGKENKIYIITPEQFSYSVEKKLLDKVDSGAIINAEVLTFKRMAYRVANEVGGATKTTLSKAGKSMLIYSILQENKSNLKFLGKSEQNIGLIDTALTEFKKHNVKVEDLKKAMQDVSDTYLKLKLQDLVNIYEKYESKIENRYIDENDDLTILANNLENTDMFDNTIIYIDEFVGFTKQEYSIIEKLLKKAKKVTVTITTDDLDYYTNPDIDVFYSNKKTADKLIYLAKSNNIECEKTVFLEETKRFKNDELKHIEKNIYNVQYTEYEKNVENIHLFLASNQYTEVENVAKEITKLVKNEKLRYKDISIITKNLETYSSLIKAIFNKYSIPVFIDEKKDLNQNSFIKYIIAVLDVYVKNWSYDSVINYIKTMYTKLEEYEIYLIENYTRKWGIKGNKWYQGEWKFEDETQQNKEELQQIRELREKIVNPLVELKKDLSGTKTVEQITTKLYQFLLENKIDETLEYKKEKLEENGYLEISKEQEIAWNIITQLFDEMILIFGDEKVTFEKYIELLRVGLNASGLGKIPQTQDEVIVGDIDRSRTHKVEAVFILGMNDGVFPTVNKQEGFLGDSDRNILKEQGVELAKGTLEALYEDNFSIYKAFTATQDKLYLSYSSANVDGAALRPSMLIIKIKKIFPQLKEKSDLVIETPEIINKKSTFEELINQIRQYYAGEKIEDIWFQVFNYYMKDDEYAEKLRQAIKAINYVNIPENITNENIEKLYGKTLNTSVSKLEKFRSCPFSYYLKYGLKISPKDNFKVQMVDTGTFMHETIDEFFNIMREKGIKVKELEEEQIDEIVDKIIEEKLSLGKNYIFTSTDKYKVLTNRLKRVIKKSMKYIVESLKNSDFEVFGNELEFKKRKNIRANYFRFR